MRRVDCLLRLISIASLLCLSNSISTVLARANNIDSSIIPEKTKRASDPQPKFPAETKTEVPGDIAKRPISPPEGKKIPEVSIVLSNAEIQRVGERVKELLKEKDILEKGKSASEGFKNVSEVIKNTLEVIAIIVGAGWTYVLFIRQRQKYPRANLAHRITHRSLGNGKLLMNIDATLSNAGTVLIRIVSGELRIQHVLPLSSRVASETADSASSFPKLGREFSWDAISHPLEWPVCPCEIEPGEENQFHYDCVLPDTTEVIKVYSYYKNEVKSGRALGWNLTTVYDLKANESMGRKENAMKFTVLPGPPKPVPMPEPGPSPLQEPRKPYPGK